jgi:ribosome-associated toxin RatA of RatAB toxin-antitoxin module
MPTVHRNALVPHSPAEMFALINDVAAYPSFLPWCAQAEIREQGADRIVASLTVTKGTIRQTFTTENRLDENRRIEVRLVDGPFRKLHGVWRFDPVGERGCKISLDMEFEFSNRLLGLTFGGLFHQISNTLVDAFCRRAREVYKCP